MLELETETFTYTDRKGNAITLTLTEADVERGTQRFTINAQMKKVVEDAQAAGHPYSPEAAYDLTLIFPNLVASVTKAEGLNWPPTADEFLRMPEQLWDKWSTVARRLNPHWFPEARLAPTVEEEKKEPSGEPTPSTSA